MVEHWGSCLRMDVPIGRGESILGGHMGQRGGDRLHLVAFHATVDRRLWGMEGREYHGTVEERGCDTACMGPEHNDLAGKGWLHS